jgi:threonine dehydrogenase-like Zn-dependent dehydrogenase
MVWVVDISDDHLQVAERLDGIRTVNSRADPNLQSLKGETVDVCFEAVGHVDTVLRAAVKLVRPFGTLVLLGFGHPGGLSTSAVVFQSLTVRGSNGRTRAEFQEALGLMATGQLRVEPLISGRYPLKEMETAFTRARERIKVVVEP